MSERTVVSTTAAPQPAGAYNQAVAVGNIIFTAGFGPQDVTNGNAVPEGVAEQTRQVMRNVETTLKEAGFSLSDVVKTTVHLQNLSDWAEFDAAYGEFFPENAPARTTVGSDLANILVEIDVVAIKS